MRSNANVLVFKPHYCKRPMRFGSRGPCEFGRSSRKRHRNALTEKAWEDAVQGEGPGKQKRGQSIAFPIISKIYI